jgi:hypothetical protein
MKPSICAAFVMFLFSFVAAYGQTVKGVPSAAPTKIEMGSAAAHRSDNIGRMNGPDAAQLRGLRLDLPVTQLAKMARLRVPNDTVGVRSAKDAELYRAASPAVVEILNQRGIWIWFPDQLGR